MLSGFVPSLQHFGNIAHQASIGARGGMGETEAHQHGVLFALVRYSGKHPD